MRIGAGHARSKIKINLLTPQGYQEKIAFFTRWALSYGRLILIITEILVIAVFAMRFKLDADIADAHEELKRQQATVEALARVEQEFLTFLQTLIEADRRINMQEGSIERITRFRNSIGPSITIETLSFDSTGQVRLTARAPSQQAFRQFYQHLLVQKEIMNVSLGTTTVSHDGITFSLTGMVPGIAQPEEQS